MGYRQVGGFRDLMSEFRKSKTGVAGLVIVLFFSTLSLTVPLVVPVEEMKKWNDPKAWLDNPPNAPPEWVSLISGSSFPRSEVLNAQEKSRTSAEGITVVEHEAVYRFDYDAFPASLILTLGVNFSGKPPVLTVLWEKPNGDRISLYTIIPKSPNLQERLFITTDAEVKRRLAAYVASKVGEQVKPGDIEVEPTLLSKAGPGMHTAARAEPLRGDYRLKIIMLAFNPDDQLTSARLSVGGKVFGAFGTDSQRRDLTVGILWGAPIALGIGLSVSVISTFIGLFLGVISGYYGGSWRDESIQRLTDFMISIPTLPILILISVVFRVDILFLILWLTVFGWMGVTKISRTMALQLREELYVEAARAIGEKDFWIVMRHVAPQILPYSFAVIALSVPGVIFTEAALSFLGLGDPTVVTWGKILHEAQVAGATVNGFWWWVVIPGALIVLVAMGFGLLGNALDRILQPQLRVRR